MERLVEMIEAGHDISTDSRKITEGAIYFALKGLNFNGNAFAQSAIDKGASIVVIDEIKDESIKNASYILVEDVLSFLQELSKVYRHKQKAQVLALTGSNGKTTTKELIKVVLTKKYNCISTKGNLNNHIGVPLTLLSIKKDTELAIIEMGANHLKEIEEYCTWANPDIGLITNVGKAHLEGFGSFEGVKKAKSELYQHLSKNKGLAFINTNEKYLEGLAVDVTKKLCYGNEQIDIKYRFRSVDKIHDGFSSCIEEESQTIIQSKLVGAYNYENLITAISIGKYFEVPIIDIKEAIESYVPEMMRSQLIHKNTNKIILDAYNANPSSMKEAVQTIIADESPKKVLILGAMKELGEYSDSEHQSLLDFVQEYRWEKVLLYGQEYGPIDCPNSYAKFDTIESLSKYIKEKAFQNALILIKGSRSNTLEKVLASL